MYIKSDYKVQYFHYIRESSYSPITVRNIISDTNSFFVWLSAYNFGIAIDKIISQYEHYLILRGTAINTMNRKMSSLRKFIEWVRAEYPHVEVSSQINSNPKIVRLETKTAYRAHQSRMFFVYILGFLVILLILSSLILKSRGSSPINISTLAVVDSSSKYSIQFDIALDSAFDASVKSNIIFTFKFYTDVVKSNSIGYVLCPYIESMSDGGSSRLKINIDRNCSPLTSMIRDVIDRGDAVYADVYINNTKLTASRIHLNSSQYVNSESNHQSDINDHFNTAGSARDLLPKVDTESVVLGSETITSPLSTSERIPLSMFQNVPVLEDGDIVSIYDSELVKALLSTRVIGIKSSDSIITHGVAYIHVLNTDNNPITIGDYISTSAIPGYGQKASNKYDTLVGVVVEPYLPDSNFVKILITNH